MAKYCQLTTKQLSPLKLYILALQIWNSESLRFEIKVLEHKFHICEVRYPYYKYEKMRYYLVVSNGDESIMIKNRCKSIDDVVLA